MNIKPMPGFIIAKPEEPEETTKSGLYLPGNDDEKPVFFRVHSVGEKIFVDGAWMVCDLKKNDIIIVKKFSGYDVEIDGIKYTAITFKDVIALIS